MSNLAEKIAREQQKEKQRQVEKKRAAVKKKKILTPGERLLWMLLVLLLLIGSVQIVAKQSAIYEANKELQDVKSKIVIQEKVNNDLEEQVSELSKYERILFKAKQLGLELNEKNIKVVHD